jgi:putative transposase
VRKVWHALQREVQEVARSTVERLMSVLDIQGVVRGKRTVTMNPEASQFRPDDMVNWLFMADRSNKLWVSDFICGSTRSGTVHVAFVNDVVALRIVGRRASTLMKTQFVSDALEKAVPKGKTLQNNLLDPLR